MSLCTYPDTIHSICKKSQARVLCPSSPYYRSQELVPQAFCECITLSNSAEIYVDEGPLRAVTNDLEQNSRPSRSNDQPLSRRDQLKRIAINCFLVFHILAITCWCFPIEIPGLLAARRFVRPYFLWSGLFQSWDMFAPTPKSANTYVEAQIRYKDGTEKVWTLPRMQPLGLTDKFIKERYRKFEDGLIDDANDAILTDVARHIARSQSTPANPVKLVVLIYSWSFFSPDSNGSFVPQPWEQHVLLGYGVRPEDLR